MWQQGQYQPWSMGGYSQNHQNPQNVDWGALAQAWRQNQESQANPAQQMMQNPMVAPNMQMNNQQWHQQPSWSNQQWNNTNWNNQPSGPGFNIPPQQWMPQQQQNVNTVPTMHVPSNDLKPPPPLPPLPPDDNFQSDAPPGTVPDIEAKMIPDADIPIPPPLENMSNSPGMNLLHDEQQVNNEFTALSEDYNSQKPPGLLEYPTSSQPEDQWKLPVPVPGQWESHAAPQSQWTGGNVAPWYGGGQMNQFAQEPGVGMMTNSMAPAMDTGKRKTLPAWIREGLEKMEQDKVKESEKEVAAVETKKPQLDVDGRVAKSKFESGSEAESDAELPQDEEIEQEEPAEVEEEESEEMKAENMLLKVRRWLTEVLLDVTNNEMKDVAQEVFKKETKAPAKQLVRSTALSSISQLGVVAGYSSDDDSNDEEAGEDAEDPKSSDEDEMIERKVEAFNKKQLNRIRMLEANEVDYVESALKHNVMLQTDVQDASDERDHGGYPSSEHINDVMESKKKKSTSDDKKPSVSNDENLLEQKEATPEDLDNSSILASESSVSSSRKSDKKSKASDAIKKHRSPNKTINAQPDVITGNITTQQKKSTRDSARSQRGSVSSPSRDRKKKEKSKSVRSKRSRSRSREKKDKSRHTWNRSTDRKEKDRSFSSERRSNHKLLKKSKSSGRRESKRRRDSSTSQSPKRYLKRRDEDSRKRKTSVDRIKSSKSKREKRRKYDDSDEDDRRKSHKKRQVRDSKLSKKHSETDESSSNSSDLEISSKKQKASNKKKSSQKGKRQASSTEDSSSSSSDDTTSSDEESSPRYVELKSHKPDKYVRQKSKSHSKKSSKR